MIPMSHRSQLIVFAIALYIFLSAGCTPSPRLGAGAADEAEPQNTTVILATTTSTQDSGLLDVLVPLFEQQSGYFVKIIAVGTGQALKMGERGDADVLLVHAPSAEQELVESGAAVDRRLVMYNDFVIVGPATDPAGIRGMALAGEAFGQIADSGAPFVSRGDDSGTHKKELSIWQEESISPEVTQYLESGQGMGATLRIASEKEAYTLTDRATFLAQSDTLDLEILVEGDAALLNIYHVMSVNPERWPAVNDAGASSWSEFLTSEETQIVIGRFGTEEFGQPLFFPAADQSEAELGLE
jgi:tungstate transport system substrate-binding protein